MEPGITGTTLIEGAISQSLVTKQPENTSLLSTKVNAMAPGEGGKEAGWWGCGVREGVIHVSCFPSESVPSSSCSSSESVEKGDVEKILK